MELEGGKVVIGVITMPFYRHYQRLGKKSLCKNQCNSRADAEKLAKTAVDKLKINLVALVPVLLPIV